MQSHDAPCGFHATGRWCWHDTANVVGATLLGVVLILVLWGGPGLLIKAMEP